MTDVKEEEQPGNQLAEINSAWTSFINGLNLQFQASALQFYCQCQNTFHFHSWLRHSETTLIKVSKNQSDVLSTERAETAL